MEELETDLSQLGEAASHGVHLTGIAFVIVVAVSFGLIMMRLRQPAMVGFILAGILMGPTGFGLITSSESVSALAQMGVLVLLFFIGMELSIKAFILSLRPALLVATGQLAAALLIAAGIAYLIGASRSEAIILGFIIALSSTVVAMRMLDEMDELRREAGRLAVGVLIAQDLAVVPMLIFITSLGRGDLDPFEIVVKIGFAVAVLAGLLWWLGRSGKLRVPLQSQIENNVEILALGSLAFCFAAASVSGVLGLSPAYGAFVAGLIVGASTLRAKVIPVIEPIQSVLLVVFFLSIGLLIDLSFIVENLGLVIGASILAVVAKSVLNVLLFRMAGARLQTSVLAGLSMAQIGEFSFILAAAGLASGALGGDIYRLAIAVTAITLLVSPLWISISRRIERIASESAHTYREALTHAYEEELAGGRNAIRRTISEPLLRYQAARKALNERKRQRRDARRRDQSGDGD